jgi:hypothetical protein
VQIKKVPSKSTIKNSQFTENSKSEFDNGGTSIVENTFKPIVIDENSGRKHLGRKRLSTEMNSSVLPLRTSPNYMPKRAGIDKNDTDHSSTSNAAKIVDMGGKNGKGDSTVMDVLKLLWKMFITIAIFNFITMIVAVIVQDYEPMFDCKYRLRCFHKFSISAPFLSLFLTFWKNFQLKMQNFA